MNLISWYLVPNRRERERVWLLSDTHAQLEVVDALYGMFIS